MNVAAIFQALSQAIFTSLGHALIIYILTRLVLSGFKELSSSWRYNLLYSSLVLISAGFIISLIKFYYSGLAISPESTGAKFLTSPSGGSLQTWKTFTGPYTFWIALIYLCGLVIQTFYLFLGYYRLKLEKYKSYKPASIFWIKRLEDLKFHLGIPQNITLHFSDQILIPFTAGFIKPVILLPLATINQLSIDQVEAILLHELAHIKRNDYLLNIIQRLMEIILFFNPIIWILVRQIKAEREFSCDDMVLQHTQNPGNYARALVLIEEHRFAGNSLAQAISGNTKYNLLNRIKKITDMKPQNSNSRQKLLALLSVLVISLSLAWVIPADSTKNRKSKNLNTESALAPVKQGPGARPAAPPPPPAPPALIPGIQKHPIPQPPVPKHPEMLIPPIPPAPMDTNELKNVFKSPEWKKQIEQMKIAGEEMRKQFNSPEWKKQIEEMKIAGEEMKKQFNSPEWKKQMEQMKIETEKMKKQFDSPEWKKQMEQMKVETEKMKKQFDSPEWKKQMDQMKIETEKMKKQFDSPEWKKQMEEMKIETEKIKKQFNSPEWKKKMELELKEENSKAKTGIL